MATHLAENTYGSSRIHLLRVSKQQGRHDIREVGLSIRFEGDFEAAHTRGDNRKILPADTMNNTVYALARQHSLEPLENFGQHLIEHFLTYNPQVHGVVIEASENSWTRLPQGGKPHASAFASGGNEERICLLTGTRQVTQARAGIRNLALLKTTKASFQDFKKDPYTTLQDDRDTILSGNTLGGASIEDWNQFWQDLSRFLEILSDRYLDESGFHLATPSNQTDVPNLFSTLQPGWIGTLPR